MDQAKLERRALELLAERQAAWAGHMALYESLCQLLESHGASERLAESIAWRVLNEERKHSGESTDARLVKAREYIADRSRALSPLDGFATYVGCSTRVASTIMQQLAAEGLVRKVHKPGDPKYVMRWVRTKP